MESSGCNPCLELQKADFMHRYTKTIQWTTEKGGSKIL